MTKWQTTGVLELALDALSMLGAVEVEVEISATYAPIYLEAADRQEVIPVDTRDPAGGFGAVDLWIATLIPALAAARGQQAAGTLTRTTLEALVEQMVHRSKSPRAKRQIGDLKSALCQALGIEQHS